MSPLPVLTHVKVSEQAREDGRWEMMAPELEGVREGTRLVG